MNPNSSVTASFSILFALDCVGPFPTIRRGHDIVASFFHSPSFSTDKRTLLASVRSGDDPRRDHSGAAAIGALPSHVRHHAKFAWCLRACDRALWQSSRDFLRRFVRGTRPARRPAVLDRKDRWLHAGAPRDGHAQAEAVGELGTDLSGWPSLLHAPEGVQFSPGSTELSADTSNPQQND